MKKLFVILFVSALVLSACLPGLGQVTVNEVQPSPTPYPIQPTYTPLAQPTESATAEILPTASPIPATQTLVPTLGAVVDEGTPLCNNHGVTAWNPENRTDGGTYGEVPVGGLEEPCWVVGQGWYKDAQGTPHRFLIGIKPNTISWLAGHLGGTGWYFSGTEAEVNMNLLQQAAELEARDGKMDTIIVILPDDADKLPIVVRTQVKP